MDSKRGTLIIFRNLSRRKSSFDDQSPSHLPLSPYLPIKRDACARGRPVHGVRRVHTSNFKFNIVRKYQLAYVNVVKEVQQHTGKRLSGNVHTSHVREIYFIFISNDLLYNSKNVLRSTETYIPFSHLRSAFGFLLS